MESVFCCIRRSIGLQGYTLAMSKDEACEARFVLEEKRFLDYNELTMTQEEKR